VLQVQQAGAQARGQGWAPSPGSEGRGEGALDLGPVDQAGQAHQRMAHVDQFVEPVDEQFVGLGGCRLGLHHQTSSKFARKLRSMAFHLANCAPANATNLQVHQQIEINRECTNRAQRITLVRSKLTPHAHHFGRCAKQVRNP
jgi:hypothetical protein